MKVKSLNLTYFAKVVAPTGVFCLLSVASAEKLKWEGGLLTKLLIFYIMIVRCYVKLA